MASYSRISTRHRPRGFTLIELLIVVIIIGVLMAIGVPAYLKYVAAANDRDARAALLTAYKAAIAGTAADNAKFPITTTIVNDVTADEPQLPISRGDCLGTVASSPVKRVIVDTASTTQQVSLCTKSATGTIWTLTGPLTGTPSVTDGSLVALTMSGNEITDAVRATGVQGDGLSSDSSTGVWEASTNLVTNGGFESNTTGWADNGSATTRITSDSKFGTASAQITPVGTFPGEGPYRDIAGITNPTSYTFSGWFKRAAGKAISVRAEERVGVGGAVVAAHTVSAVATGSWQRLAVSFTTAATTTSLRVFVRDGEAVADTTVFYADGVQLEQKSTATPYIETNGATQSRTAGRVQMPAALLNTSQGWISLRVRPDWASASPPASTPYLFHWADYASHEIWLSYAGGAWTAGRKSGSQSTATQTTSFASGTLMTVIAAWDSGVVKVSVNGSAFTAIANTFLPTALSSNQPTVNIGDNFYGGGEADSDILWLATGTGTLTDSDAATINGFGNNDPKRSSFPAAAQATVAWDGLSTTGSLK